MYTELAEQDEPAKLAKRLLSSQSKIKLTLDRKFNAFSPQNPLE
jgi:hypothetical protein